MKRVISLFFVFVLIFALCACSAGISGEDAKAFVNDFFQLLEKKDYEAAEAFLHPERPIDLQSFFESIEESENVDFSSISIEKYTGIESSVYNSSVDGSIYSLTMKVSVSGKIAEMEVDLVKNDEGYGIYELDIDIDS